MRPFSVLLTQCLQRDFVDPVRPHDPLPNRLHVGHDEARRLMGVEPAFGPVAQLMAWARAQPADDLAVVHIRDVHDPADPAQRDHLETFGPHCLRGTRGANLVLELDAGLGPGEQVVDGGALGDFEGTALPDVLAGLRARAAGRELRFGVVGVWTEAKVHFLLYDLKTRLGVDALATCSALTASSSRQQHFLALDQLRRILGVTVTDSVQGFVSWLAPGARVEAPRLPARLGPRVTVVGPDGLCELDRAVLDVLYRDSREVTLHPIGGGFSGARVFGARSVDALGRQEAPSVVKLGQPELIGKERAAFERVEAVLGNSAPALRGFVDAGERAGIKYSYAAMGAGPVRTFKRLWSEGAPDEQVRRVLDVAFGEVLASFTDAARYEPLPLLDHYQFRRYASGTRALVAPLADPDAPALEFPGGVTLPNVVRFYEEVLPSLPDVPGESHYVSTAHGDLNAANILVDARDNVWLVDFFHTAPGHHVLRDAAKLENDLLYVLTPLADEDALAQALRVTAALRRVQDLRDGLPETPPEGVDDPALLRAWRTLGVLRARVAELVREDRHPLQLSIALLRYAVHTLSFDESSPLQRRWALAAACGHADDVERTWRAERTLRVDWVAGVGPGRIGLTLCPGRRDKGRALDEDLAALREAGARWLVTLVPDEELDAVGVPDLRARAEAAGLRTRALAILDQGVPTLQEARDLARHLLAAVEAGEDVVLHCMGGLGRTGTIAACALVARGLDAAAAISAVRAARGPRCVENAVQEAFVHDFARA